MTNISINDNAMFLNNSLSSLCYLTNKSQKHADIYCLRPWSLPKLFVIDFLFDFFHFVRLTMETRVLLLLLSLWSDKQEGGCYTFISKAELLTQTLVSRAELLILMH